MTKKKAPKPILQPGCAIYLRTSNKESQNPAASQERQLFNIEHYLIRQNNFKTVAVYSDVDSGLNPKRKDYQRMLADARLGKFSHVAVENPERFGRYAEEAIRAFNELKRLGIQIRFSTYPFMDSNEPTAEFTIQLFFVVSQYESNNISMRVKGGLRTKLLNGGCIALAPDGYLNVEERTDSDVKMLHGRYRRWVEKDAKQWPVIREAWDLLLEDKLTLEGICETLHQRGYRLRSGRRFVSISKTGKKAYPLNTLSRIFHNPFYAAWVVSEQYNIPFGELRGRWQPMVTDEEFARASAILARRAQVRVPEHKHFYLLKGLLYLQDEAYPSLIRLTCSRPNTHRKNGGTPYYCVRGTGINLLCRQIDELVPQLLHDITVEEDDLPYLRLFYQHELELRQENAPQLLAQFQRTLKRIEGKLERLLELYLDEELTREKYDARYRLLKQEEISILGQLALHQQSNTTNLQNLEDALQLLHQISTLYVTLSPEMQRQALRLVVEKVVLNRDGEVLAVELLPPFAYLHGAYERLKKQIASWNQKRVTAIFSGSFEKYLKTCSDLLPLGVLDRIYTEHAPAEMLVFVFWLGTSPHFLCIKS